MKRILSSLSLATFIMANALPCQAAFVRCGMKMPARESVCGICVGKDASSAPALTAGTCCSVEPARDRESTPSLTGSSFQTSAAHARVALAASPGAIASDAPASARFSTAPPDPGGPTSAPSGSTILRL